MEGAEETARLSVDPGSDPAAGPVAARRGEETGLYRANGLTLRSEINLPELHPGAGRADVEIRYGTSPTELDDAALKAPRAQASPGEYLLTVDGVGRYWVRDGRTVVLDPAAGATEDDVRVFLLSSVMGVLAHEHGFLPLHASAVSIDGACVLLAGSSGVGKSTMAAALHRRGHPVVADDICAISLGPGGDPLLQPGYRHLKLWGDALEHVGRELGEHRRIRPGTDKYSVILPGGALPDPFPVSRIFVLTPEMVRLDEEVEVRPLRGRAKVAALLRETYRFRLVAGLGRSGRHLRLCHELARSTPVALLRRAIHPSHLSRSVAMIEGAVRQPPEEVG